MKTAMFSLLIQDMVTLNRVQDPARAAFIIGPFFMRPLQKHRQHTTIYCIVIDKVCMAE